jgi:hypothetical protein
LGMIKQRRSSWRGSSATTAQLGGQNKANCVRRRRAARSGCLHVGFRYGNGTLAFLDRLPIAVSLRFCTILLGVRENFLLVP